MNPCMPGTVKARKPRSGGIAASVSECTKDVPLGRSRPLPPGAVEPIVHLSSRLRETNFNVIERYGTAPCVVPDVLADGLDEVRVTAGSVHSGLQPSSVPFDVALPRRDRQRVARRVIKQVDGSIVVKPLGIARRVGELRREQRECTLSYSPQPPRIEPVPPP